MFYGSSSSRTWEAWEALRASRSIQKEAEGGRRRQKEDMEDDNI
jgi:hypothetical protein